MTELLKPEHFDMAIFEQILELDDGDSRSSDSFSWSLVEGFFDQADTTFVDMEAGLKAGDLNSLHQLGHFLKGSSATLGLHKIKDACEKIQNLGAGKDESGMKDLNDPEYALNTIRAILLKMKRDYEDAAGLLKKFYRMD